MMDFLDPEILVLLGIAAACLIAQSIAVAVMVSEIRGIARSVASLVQMLHFHRGPK